VYLTEQAPSVVEALKKAGLDERDEGLKILQWKDARDRPWPKLIGEVFEYAVEIGAGLIVVDTLNRFAGLRGEDENQAGAVSEVMGALMAAAQTHNIAVLSIRHANKGGRARGSTQFDHDVDALFELKRPDGNMGDNVRVLEGIGRSDDIPSKLTIELGPDGYHNLGDAESVRFKMAVRAIREAVSKTPDQPTPKTELEKALQDEHNVALATARRAVKWLCDQGDLVRTGEGKRGAPYMFHMPPVEVREIKK
jgi:nicotinamidase-related amidase